MKKIILALMIIFANVNAYSQCSTNPIYQDSTYNIWPDTNVNLPVAVQSISYHAELNIKTPATLIEAAAGDSSFTQLDTTILGTSYSFQLADWPVDSMSLVSIDGLPNGLSLSCTYNNCILPGNVLTCASLDGTSSDPIGVYPITIWVDVYTHGILDLGIIQYPLSTSLFDATGSYESVTGYKIVISNTSSYEMFNSTKLTLLQSVPNPSNGNTIIKFNTPKSENISFNITDMFGKIIYSKEIESISGLNTININEDLSAGIYTYSIKNDEKMLSKRMVISK